MQIPWGEGYKGVKHSPGQRQRKIILKQNATMHKKTEMDECFYAKKRRKPSLDEKYNNNIRERTFLWGMNSSVTRRLCANVR